MFSKEFMETLSGVIFPRKLWLLATSSEVRSIRWARNGTTVEIDSVLLCEECFQPHIFNVKSNQHVLRQLSYYKFEKLDQKKKLWEFKHPNFLAGKADLLQYIKRTPQRVPKKFVKDVERRCSPRIRSLPKNRTATYSNAFSTDDELDVENEDVPKTTKAKKAKYDDIETISNEIRYILDAKHCLHTEPVEVRAVSSAYSFNKSSIFEPNNIAKNPTSNEIPKQKNPVIVSIRRKRGRPKKSSLVSTRRDRKMPYEAKMEEIQQQADAREYYKQAERKSSKTFSFYNSWRGEEQSNKDKSPMWSTGIGVSGAQMSSKQLLKDTQNKANLNRQEKNGMIDDSSYYHGIVAELQTSQGDAARWFPEREDIFQRNPPSTSTGNNNSPLMLKMSRDDSKGNGEPYFMIKEEFGNSVGGVRAGSTNAIPNQTTINLNSNNCQFPTGYIPTSRQSDSASDKFFFSDNRYQTTSEILGRSSEKLQPYLTSKFTASPDISHNEKQEILAAVSGMQNDKFCKEQPVVLYNTINQHIDHNYVQTPNSNMEQKQDPETILPNYDYYIDSNLIKSDVDTENQANISSDLIDLGNNCDENRNNNGDSPPTNQNRKSSQSCWMVPLTIEYHQPHSTTSANCSGQNDGTSSNINYCNYSSANDDDYLGDLIIDTDIAETTPKTLCQTISNNAVFEIENFQETVSADESELVDLNKHNSNSPPPEFIPSIFDSSIQTLEEENDKMDVSSQNLAVLSSESILSFAASLSSGQTFKETDNMEQSKHENISSHTNSSLEFEKINAMGQPEQNSNISTAKSFQPSADSSLTFEETDKNPPRIYHSIFSASTSSAVHHENKENGEECDISLSSQDRSSPLSKILTSPVKSPGEPFQERDNTECPNQKSHVSESCPFPPQSGNPEKSKIASVDEQIDRIIDGLRANDVIFLEQINKPRRFPVLNANTDSVRNSSQAQSFEELVVPSDFFVHEFKPMTLFDFLESGKKSGKLYSFIVQNSDIVIRDCAADFSDWLRAKSGRIYDM